MELLHRNHRPSADLSTFIEFYKGEFVSEHETEMHRAPSIHGLRPKNYALDRLLWLFPVTCL